MLAVPVCGFTVSRVIVPLEDAFQLHGTEPQAVSKPGFCTRFVAAPADATPKTNAATTTKPRSIVRTAVNISILLLPPSTWGFSQARGQAAELHDLQGFRS